MAHIIKDRVKQTCSAPSTSSPFDFTGSATETGFQTFVDALANGDTCLYSAFDSSGNWETGLGTWTEASDQLARTKILASSNSGSAETFSGTVTVAITMPARDVESAYKEARGMIRGLEISYSSTTAIVVASGVAAINNSILTYAGATLTSGSTMTDLAGSTVTIGASKCYFVFLYDNSGTAEIRIEERDGTGDGADPTWDSDLDYWISASTGAAARRIGKFWTNASSQIARFVVESMGRYKRLYIEYDTAFRVVNGGTATTYTSVTVTPWVTADDESTGFLMQVVRATGTNFLSVRLRNMSSGERCAVLQTDNDASSFVSLISAPIWLGNTGTVEYMLGSATNITGTIFLMGAGYLV